ncbi:MAG TPA: hypothetical protein VK902_25160 [Rubrobacter sp.]|nr:hypothetical protein [Rubrobacter sp.]
MRSNEGRSDVRGYRRSKGRRRKVLTGTRPAGRAFPRTKRALVVAVALLALAAFATMIPAAEAPNANHYYSAAESTAGQSVAGPTSPALHRKR